MLYDYDATYATRNSEKLIHTYKYNLLKKVTLRVEPHIYLTTTTVLSNHQKSSIYISQMILIGLYI